MVAYSSCCSPPDPLFVANIDGTGVRQISAKGQDVYGAQWSPDGSMLVYQQRDGSTQHLGNLFVQDVATGQRTQITNFDQSQSWDWWFTFPSFAPDRPYVFFQLPRGVPTDPVWDLWCVSQTGGTPILVRRDAGWGGLGAGLLFNLAYLSPISKDDFTGGGLWIDSFDERAVIPRGLFPPGHLTWLRWSPGGKRISYADRGSIYVLDVTTDKIRRVAKGGTAEWFNDHTLIVGPGG
jgi:Tol biopolymer transport system component